MQKREPISKKSFILYLDSLEIEKDLTDEELGKFFRAIIKCQKSEKFTLPKNLNLAFKLFENQFSRDNEKYKKTCAARAVAGSLGGLAKVANASKCKQIKQNIANVADTDTDTDNETENENKNTISRFEKFWEAYGKKVGKKKCLEIWKHKKITAQLANEKIIPAAKKYQKEIPDSKYQKDPERWLRDERWNDEPKINKLPNPFTANA